MTLKEIQTEVLKKILNEASKSGLTVYEVKEIFKRATEEIEKGSEAKARSAKRGAFLKQGEKSKDGGKQREKCT